MDKKIKLKDYEENKIDIDEVIDSGKRFLLDMPNLWMNMSIDKTRKLQDYLLPEGIHLENNEF